MPSRLIALTALVLAAGCGSLPTGPCALIADQCQCYARSDCRMVMEGCFCPSECGAKVVCVCGGGKFVGCASS